MSRKILKWLLSLNLLWVAAKGAKDPSQKSNVGQRIVEGSQRAICGKIINRAVVSTMAIINMLVPL